MRFKFYSAIAFLLLCFSAAADILPPRPATQTEVNAGTDGQHPVTPKTLSSWTGAGGTTNGQTGAQVQGAITAADASGTNLMKPSSLVLGQITISTNASTGTITWSNTTAHIALATLQTNGLLTANGASITNINGVNFQIGTVSSNSFDAGTKAQLALAGSGSSFPLSGDVSAANHAIVGISDLGLTNSSRDAHLDVGAIGAGGYLVVALTGNTNGVPSFTWFTADQISATTINVSQANIGTSWLTNVVSPTNAFAGTTVDFAQSYGTTNLGGNLTFTAVANVTAGAENTRIIHLLSGGADRTIAFPVNWHTNLNFIGVVTNGWEMDLLVSVQPGVRTNVAQILYP